MKNIAIIGIDGSGKSTQAAMLAKAINGIIDKSASVVKGRSTNYEVFKLIQEKGTEEISQYTFLVGYSLDLAYNFMKIEREKDENRTYIWDRYSHCLEAYFKALDLDLRGVLPIIYIVKKAYITFYLDIEPELAVNRIKQRGGIIKPLENVNYLSKVRDQYNRIINASDVEIIDASKSQDEVHKEIWKKYLLYNTGFERRD